MSELNSYRIERHYLCMHITAIKILGHFLFVGEGNQVTVFSLKSKKIVKSEVIFSSSSIHGIKTDGHSNVLFFGSKSLKVYCFDSTSLICLKSYSEEILLPDWIFDVHWLTGISKDHNNVVVITAHNCITMLNVGHKKLKAIPCAENCILYSASILLADDNVIIVAVGTVFKQILLWSPNSTNEVNKAKVPFHCLEGHKGVIFSVNFNKYNKLLSSTSDDRSIRLWKVNSVSDNVSSLEFWEKSDICPSHILYAHESRVWTSVILKNGILSVGEDSCICFWNMDGELLKRKKCHKNGSIWCLETSNSLQECFETVSSKNYIAITGGSDGGVYCWEVKNIMSTDLVSQVSLCSRSSGTDFPRSVSIINCDNSERLMVTTDKGWLSLYDICSKTWKDVYHDATFESYCISSVSNKSVYIALGNLNGDLVMLNSQKYDNFSDYNNFKKFKIHSGKIFSLHWVDEKSEYLLSCGAEGYMILWKVEFLNDEFSISKFSEFYLPKCKPHWWSTCAIYLDTSYLVVGDRGGSINFYSSDTNFHQLSEPNMIHKYIHGENGVTDIKEHQSLIYSAGRDGRVLLYKLKGKSLHLLHAIKISHDLEWIGKFLFYDSDLLLLGFHTKYFIVWSTALESTVMTVECGGGHRSWNFHLSEEGQASFTAIKKKDIIFKSENLYFTLRKSALKVGVSGKEFCQTCYLFNSESSSSGSMDVFAAGGENNALQIIGFNNNVESPEIIILNSLSGHLSSIRSLAKTNMIEDNTYLLVSVGGRAQMMLWKIKNNLSMECVQLGSYILSTFEKMNRKSLKESQDVQLDPQTRLMDVIVHMNNADYCNGQNYTIALACSDSFFRVYNFDAMEKLLSLCYNIQLGENCILKLSCIQYSIEFNNSLFFIVGTTSGHLNFVNHEDLKSLNDIQNINCDVKHKHELQFCIHAHQSGINAIDIKHISGKIWLICTGGDDNALSALIIQFHSSLKDCEVIAKAKVHSAHSSQITGVKFLGQNIIVSVSVDQRINLWKWSYYDSFLNIIMDTSKMSAIPDIANLECWKHGNNWTAVVCGEGIEILSIQNVL